MKCIYILNDRHGYEILPNNPNPQYKQELEGLVDKALNKRLIDKNEHKFLLPDHPVMATFYCLPKIYMGLTPLKGRPVVLGVGSLTQNIGVYLDNVLRVYVVSLPSYVRDTTDLLKLEGICR